MQKNINICKDKGEGKGEGEGKGQGKGQGKGKGKLRVSNKLHIYQTVFCPSNFLW